MHHHMTQKALSLLLSTSILFTIAPLPCQLTQAASTTTASANTAAVDMKKAAQLDVQSLTRVDETSISGLVRSHLEDATGQIYTDSDQQSVDTTNRLTSKKASTLPASYDLRTLGLETSIKDQGVTGSCWSFAAIKSIESNAIKTGLTASAETTDYSESHLAWFSYNSPSSTADALYGDGISTSTNLSSFPLSSLGQGASSNTAAYENGGSAILAAFTLAKWSGVDLDANAPFTANSSEEMATMARSMSASESLRYNSSAHLQNALAFDEYVVGENYYLTNSATIIPAMKQSILDNGAMDIAVYYNANYMNQTSGNGTAYYQTAYSTPSTAVEKANHCITIVGWDDSYSRTNFSKMPSKDGAWLIANSYGTDTGDNGYFWLSYYDASICDCYSFQVEPVNNYGHIYQYDGYGWGNATYSTSSLKAGNVFTVDTTTPQQISAVSFYTLTDNQKYTVQVYRNVSSTATNPTQGTLINSCTISGTEPHNGYHTVKLTSPVNVAAGERFSIVITYISNGSKVYLPYEGSGSTASNYSLNYTSATGQSYIYTPVVNWVDSSSYGKNNVCIKAFTNDTTVADPLPENTSGTSTTKSTSTKISINDTTLVLAHSSVAIGKGEKHTLKNKTGNTLTYTSEDNTIATVSSSGKIKGIDTGTTTILISNGSTSTSLKVTVKKAPSKLNTTPSKKKSIKRRRSFQIKTKIPSGSLCNTYTYHTSKKKIATVSSTGKVKALKKGKATIKVKTYNGKTATIKLTVK